VLFAGIVAAGVAEEMLTRRLQPAPASRQGR
jgi:hypothetical protein